MSKNILIAIIFMAMQLLADDKPAIGGMKDFDYVNSGTNTVTITVPYFVKTNTVDKVITLSDFFETNAVTRLISIALEPGDAYFCGSIAKRQNGSLHKKYGLMPVLAGQAVKGVPIWSSYIPEWKEWEYILSKVVKENDMLYYTSYVDRCSRDFERGLRSFSSYPKKIQRWSKIYGSEDQDYKDATFYRELLSAVTNTPVNAMESIYDLNADSDGDGLTNREEFELDTNALIRDWLVISPVLLEVPPLYQGTTTNFFTLRNLSDKDWSCGIGFKCQYDYFPWKPKIVSVDGTKLESGSSARFIYGCRKLIVKAKSEAKLALLCDAEKLPAKFRGYCNIGVALFSKETDRLLNNEIYVFIRSGRKIEVVAPATEMPENGSRFVHDGSATNIVFTWGDSSCKPNKKHSDPSELFELLKKRPARYSIAKYDSESTKNKAYNFRLYKLEDNNKLDDIFDVYNERFFSIKRNKNYQPGLYLWRISKIDIMGYPVASDWSWFSVGEEIKPEMDVSSANKASSSDEMAK